MQAEARGYQRFAASCEHQPENMNLRALIEKTPDAKLLPDDRLCCGAAMDVEVGRACGS